MGRSFSNKTLAFFNSRKERNYLTRYFMKFTPLFAAEVQMMTPPRHQPRRSGRIRSSFRYSADDVRCKDCTRYDSGHPCHLNECVCLEERIEAGVVELNALARECFGGRMFRPLQRRLRDELNRQSFRFFLSDAHRERWTHWKNRCYRRMVSLCKRAVDMSDETLLSYVTEAYPIVVFCKQLENKQRRMMEIMECEILPNGDRRYNTLFRYVITENHMEDGKFVIEGHHTQVNEISVSLRKRLLENGMPNEELQALLKPEKEVNAT